MFITAARLVRPHLEFCKSLGQTVFFAVLRPIQSTRLNSTQLNSTEKQEAPLPRRAQRVRRA